MSYMDYYEAAARERQEYFNFEPPFCDGCGGEHETDNCPIEEGDDDEE